MAFDFLRKKREKKKRGKKYKNTRGCPVAHRMTASVPVTDLWDSLVHEADADWDSIASEDEEACSSWLFENFECMQGFVAGDMCKMLDEEGGEDRLILKAIASHEGIDFVELIAEIASKDDQPQSTSGDDCDGGAAATGDQSPAKKRKQETVGRARKTVYDHKNGRWMKQYKDPAAREEGTTQSRLWIRRYAVPVVVMEGIVDEMAEDPTFFGRDATGFRIPPIIKVMAGFRLIARGNVFDDMEELAHIGSKCLTDKHVEGARGGRGPC